MSMTTSLSLPSSKRLPPTVMFPLLLALVVGTLLLSAGVGAVRIAPGQIVAILADTVSIHLPWRYSPEQAGVLLAVRLPRVVLGAIVGSGLATAGAAMQGLFRNPLADPGLIGVSAGASLGAVTTIVLGATYLPILNDLLGPYAVPVAAFVGGLATTSIVYRISGSGTRAGNATMLLTGIAINALAGSVTGLLAFLASDPQLRDITFWSLGSLGGADWATVRTVAPFILVAVILLPRHGNALNAITLGENEAGHLGVHVHRLRRSMFVLCSLAVGASVAVTGIIGFVPLVVPHIVRLTIGPDHRYLLLCSALLGGVVLSLADMVARTLVSPTELPIGIITAAAGAPFFLWLLLRTQRGETI